MVAVVRETQQPLYQQSLPGGFDIGAIAYTRMLEMEEEIPDRLEAFIILVLWSHNLQVVDPH